jgi:hypothetical protein
MPLDVPKQNDGKYAVRHLPSLTERNCLKLLESCLGNVTVLALTPILLYCQSGGGCPSASRLCLAPHVACECSNPIMQGPLLELVLNLGRLQLLNETACGHFKLDTTGRHRSAS